MKWRETIRLKKNLFEKLTRKVRAEKIRHFGPKISRSPRDRIEAPKRRLLPRCPRISRVYYFSRNNIAGRRPMSRGKWHNFPLWGARFIIYFISHDLFSETDIRRANTCQLKPVQQPGDFSFHLASRKATSLGSLSSLPQDRHKRICLSRLSISPASIANSFSTKIMRASLKRGPH